MAGLFKQNERIQGDVLILRACRRWRCRRRGKGSVGVDALLKRALLSHRMCCVGESQHVASAPPSGPQPVVAQIPWIQSIWVRRDLGG